jgi:hypothetical protein
MLSGFTTLGTKIHEDSLESMTYFQQLEAARRERERQAMLDEEEKRQFNVTAGQTDRQQNMMGIGMLAEQRGAADTNARLRAFRQGLVKGAGA